MRPIKVKREDAGLYYRVLDSTGQTIMVCSPPNTIRQQPNASLRKAIEASSNPMPRVINARQEPSISSRHSSAESQRRHSS